MFVRFRSVRPLDAFGLVLVGVVVTLVLTGTAMAVTDTAFTYSSPQTGYYMLGVGDLVPSDNLDADDYFLHPFYGGISASTACFRGGVHLPQGAKMTALRTWYDSGNSSNLSFELGRTNPGTGKHDVVAARLVADDSGVRTSVTNPITGALATVSNLYAYTFTVCVGNTTAFHGARITYTYSSAGD